MFPNQPGPYAFQQPQHRSRSPPTKRTKSNGMVITRYPLPQGYHPPAQPQHPFPQPQGWAQQPHVFRSGGNVGYIPPPTPQHHPLQHPFGRMYQPPHPPPSHPPTHQPLTPYPSEYHADPTSGIQFTDPPVPPEDFAEVASQENGLEYEYHGELSYYWAYPNEIVPELSLGIIGWHPAWPSKRPLPSLVEDGNLDTWAQRVLRPDEETSVSDYCTTSAIGETLLSVRHTSLWEECKDELIFREYPNECTEYFSPKALELHWQNRPDSRWTAEGGRSPTPELSRGPTPAVPAEPGDYPSDRRTGPSSDRDALQDARRQSDPLDVFEEIVRAQKHTSQPPDASSNHSRSQSISSQQSEKLTRPKPLPAVRDQGQEDILARLGVTGSPKTVYQTPGPAFGPPPSSNTSTQAGNSRNSSLDSGSERPQSPAKRSSRDAWSTAPAPRNIGYPPIRRPQQQRRHDSQNSNHDSARDMEVDDDATPRPKKTWTGENRKRSYADSLAGAARHDEDDDERTPKQRKTSREVPYADRW
ncbi:Hypothetical predicted protein [Lecanosticta acicola]|uniref:Uncharacterized protein n=1 Tax=Lecanosticta acicola TaxID=111012 RepID=A0AAI8Z2Q5_9PEZI|nr:Hypothetical predicted protein [Lecanosticta acicola]